MKRQKMLSAIQSDLFLVAQGRERLGRVPAERGLTTYVVPHCHATLTELWPMPPHRMSLYPRSESVSAAAIREGLAVDGRRRVLSPWRISPRDVTAKHVSRCCTHGRCHEEISALDG